MKNNFRSSTMFKCDFDEKKKAAQSLRQSILRHAFTGKLVPQDPYDESAHEFLKRIATEREERSNNKSQSAKARDAQKIETEN